MVGDGLMVGDRLAEADVEAAAGAVVVSAVAGLLEVILVLGRAARAREA